MAAGKRVRARGPRKSPILQALAAAQRGTTGEIRVHLSRRWIERDPLARAHRMFERYGMGRTAQRNAILIYVNLRRRRYAIVGDEGIRRVVESRYWQDLCKMLHEDLLSTHPENAIAIAVTTIGATLERHFPARLDEDARAMPQARD